VFESLWLTAAGIAVGVLLAVVLTGPLYALSPMASDATGNAMREFDHAVRIDVPVLLASVGVALAVGLGAGLVPAWRASRRDMSLAARVGARTPTLDRGTRRTFAALVVWEIAVAAVLLTATGLVVRSFQNLVGESGASRPRTAWSSA
jgi:putative ABC transport system permease protein